MDALNALRDAIRSRTEVKYSKDDQPCKTVAEASSIVLPSGTFPKDTPTRLRKPNAPTTASDPAKEPASFYRLDAVLLVWTLKEAGVAEYMQSARSHQLLGALVSNTERKALVEWLEGRTDTYKNLVPLQTESTTPPGTPPAQSINLPGVTLSPVKRRYVADPADAEIVKKIKVQEIELIDRTTVLRGSKQTDFSYLQTMFSERLKKLKEAQRSGVPMPNTVQKSDPKMRALKAKSMSPIIMISSSPTSLITLYNVRKFLQESSFEDPTAARQRAHSEGNTRPEDVIPIYRTLTRIDSSGQEHTQQSRYYVVDGVEALSKFGADAWERVVCVMTTGQAWQFKPYKWSEPRQLFHHVKGFYVSWSNDPPNAKIKDWNVSELQIDPHRRHIDKSVVANFWKTLDAWTLANKPWIAKQ